MLDADDCGPTRCGNAGVCIDGAGSATCSCGPGYTAFGGHCYRAFFQARTWPDARDACVADGGQLISIGDAAEQTFADMQWNSTLWIGLTDRALEGTLAWASGDPVGYTAPGMGAYADRNGQEFDCASLTGDGRWLFGPCVSERIPGDANDTPIELEFACEYAP
jgi:hypothetical protein